jgi:hypothetical protein
MFENYKKHKMRIKVEHYVQILQAFYFIFCLTCENSGIFHAEILNYVAFGCFWKI